MVWFLARPNEAFCPPTACYDWGSARVEVHSDAVVGTILLGSFTCGLLHWKMNKKVKLLFLCWKLNYFSSSWLLNKSMHHQISSQLCFCWHIKRRDIVIEMDCHPPLNWDQSQAGLCKWTMIWYECAGQWASSAKKSWLGHAPPEPRDCGSSRWEHKLV